MIPHYSDDWLTLYEGDCRDVLASLPADSVDCVVTSPPYWGLRDYGTAMWEGGDPECDHLMTPHGRPSSTLRNDGRQHSGPYEGEKATTTGTPYRNRCGKCGGVRHDGQLGLERTPEEYVANMVAVFAEVRRVLKPSGTCWLNLGDSYAGSGRGGNPEGSKWKGYVGNADRERASMPHLQSKQVEAGAIGRNWVAAPPGLKQKDLVGIPWRVAFALQADGWYLRSDIIWSKPNPMPESVTDRPTKSHEYLFLLTKSARYYYDSAAVAEPLQDSSIARLLQPNIGEQQGSFRVPGKTNGPMHAVGGPSWQERKAAGATAGNVGVSETYQNGVHGAGLSHDLGNGATRNLRSVWTISTAPYKGAHFAVFPPELPERCIKAGSPEGGLVLDPFGGSGTVGMVAQRLSRRAILIDLNPEYLKQQLVRNAQTPLGLEVA